MVKGHPTKTRPRIAQGNLVFGGPLVLALVAAITHNVRKFKNNYQDHRRATFECFGVNDLRFFDTIIEKDSKIKPIILHISKTKIPVEIVSNDSIKRHGSIIN